MSTGIDAHVFSMRNRSCQSCFGEIPAQVNETDNFSYFSSVVK